MSLPLQAKFLRMLEDGYIRRLGGTENISVDVRFLFATNKDLSKLIGDSAFREDLYYRVSVVPIQLPPLRERHDDLILLARFFVEEFNKKFNKKVKGFSREAEDCLMRYAWPGNVRELKNIIERIMILRHVGDYITAENIPAEIKVSSAPVMANQEEEWTSLLSAQGMDYKAATEQLSKQVKERILSKALELSGGNKSRAARLLKISRYALLRELKKIKSAGE
jgi:two-component system response regulator AtoC